MVPPPPDMILVTIDTLRADRVGAYGGPPEATPNRDRSGGRGAPSWDATAHVTADRAVARVNSHGGYPPRHTGSANNAGFAAVAARAHAHRAARAARVSHRGVRRHRGRAQPAHRSGAGVRGPTTIGSRARAPRRLTSVQRRASAESGARRHADGWLTAAPHLTFLWVHFYDPHAPYEPPPAFGRLSGTPVRRGGRDRRLGLLARCLERSTRSPGTCW